MLMEGQELCSEICMYFRRAPRERFFREDEERDVSAVDRSPINADAERLYGVATDFGS